MNLFQVGLFVAFFELMGLAILVLRLLHFPPRIPAVLVPGVFPLLVVVPEIILFALLLSGRLWDAQIKLLALFLLTVSWIGIFVFNIGILEFFKPARLFPNAALLRVLLVAVVAGLIWGGAAWKGVLGNPYSAVKLVAATLSGVMFAGFAVFLQLLMF